MSESAPNFEMSHTLNFKIGENREVELDAKASLHLFSYNSSIVSPRT